MQAFCFAPEHASAALDDIKVRTGPLLGDINFVTKSPKSFASSLGYCCPGWQHRAQTERLLHTGVTAWDDISHTLTATAHLPAGLLAEPLEITERAWEGDSVLAKLSVNSLIGLRGRPNPKCRRCLIDQKTMY